MALTPEQIKAWLKTLKPSQITEQKAPVIMPSTTTTTTNIMPKVTQVQPLSPKQNIMSPSLEVQAWVQAEKDYKKLATPQEIATFARMIRAWEDPEQAKRGMQKVIDRRLAQENIARWQEPKNYVDQNNQPIQPDVPLQGWARRWTASMNSLEWTMLSWLEWVNQFVDKLNIPWRVTQYIDENVQKIPTISMESMKQAFKWTPFEWMEVLPTMVANAPWSLLKTATATARGITNPFDSIVWIAKLATTPEWQDAIIQRYWSIDWLKETLTQDPVWLASDVLTLIQWGANLASKWWKLAWATNFATKASQVADIAWTAADLWMNRFIPAWITKLDTVAQDLWTKWTLGKVWQTAINMTLAGQRPIQSFQEWFTKAKGIIPTKTLDKSIQKDVLKWFRPWVKQIEIAWWQDQYVQKATEAMKTISQLKDQIELTTKDWDKISWKTPESISQLDEAIPQAKRKIYEAYSSEAEKAGTIARIDTTPIVQELVSLRDKMSKMIWWWNTVKYIDNVIKDIQNKWQMWVIDALDNTQQLNSKLQAYYRNPNPNDIWNSVVDALVNSKLKEWIDTTIDNSLVDSKYADIKKQYTNLKTIEKDVKNRSTVFARQNNKWFYDITDIFTAGEAINAISTFSPAWIVKSWWMYALKELRKYLNSPDTAVKNIFNKVNKQAWTAMSPSTTLDQKWLPLLPTQTTPITPTGTIKNPNPVAPVPLLPWKKNIIEKWWATHNPYAPKVEPVKIPVPVKPKASDTLVDLQRSKLHTEVTKPLSKTEARSGEFETQFWKIDDIVFDRGKEKYVINGKNYSPSEIKVFKKKPTSDFENILKEKEPVRTKEESYITEIAKQGWQKSSMLKQVSDDMVDPEKLSQTELVEYNKLLSTAIQKRGTEWADALETLYNKFWKDVYGKKTPTKKEVVPITTPPKKQSVLPKPQEKQAVLEGMNIHWLDKEFVENKIYWRKEQPRERIWTLQDAIKNEWLKKQFKEVLDTPIFKSSNEIESRNIHTKDALAYYDRAKDRIVVNMDKINNSNISEAIFEEALHAKRYKLSRRFDWKDIPYLERVQEKTAKKWVEYFLWEKDIIWRMEKKIVKWNKWLNYDLFKLENAKQWLTERESIEMWNKWKFIDQTPQKSPVPKPKTQAVLEDKKEVIPKAKVSKEVTPVKKTKVPQQITKEITYTKSPEWKRLADWKPIKEDSNTYRMLERAEERKLQNIKPKVDKELEPLYEEARKHKSAEEFVKKLSKISDASDSPLTYKEVVDLVDNEWQDLKPYITSNLEKTNKTRFDTMFTKYNNGNAPKDGKVEIYRVSVWDEIKPWDRVTNSIEYAENHKARILSNRGEWSNAKITKMTVWIDELIDPQYWIWSVLENEFFYAPKDIRWKDLRKIREEAQRQ